MHQELERGTAVRVKIRRSGAIPLQFPGTIDRTEGKKGAFVKTQKGIDFYFWSDIEANPEAEPFVPPRPALPPPSPPPPPPSSPRSLATLGEIIAAKVTAPPAPVEEARPSPPPPVEEEPMPKSKKKRRSYQRGEIEPSPLGSVLREERLKRRMTQAQLAKAIGMYSSEVSRAERGDRKPSDTALQAFSRLTKIPLERLEALREGRNEPEPRSRAADIVVMPQRAKAAPAAAQVLGDYTEFIAQLLNIAPMPGKPELRSEWVHLAKSLYELSFR